jgi:hypothetical protein
MPMRKVDMLVNGLMCVGNILIAVANMLDYENNTSLIRQHPLAHVWIIGSTVTCLIFVCYTVPLIALGVTYCKEKVLYVIWLNTAAYIALAALGGVVLFSWENEWLDESSNIRSTILIYAGCALTSTTITFSARDTVKGRRRDERARPRPAPTPGNTRNLGLAHVGVGVE